MEGDKTTSVAYPMRPLVVGSALNATTHDSSVLVLACSLVAPSDVDAYAWWLVLCFRPDEPVHRFVVWNAYDRPEGWALGNGDYCATASDAVKRYEERGGTFTLDEYEPANLHPAVYHTQALISP